MVLHAMDVLPPSRLPGTTRNSQLSGSSASRMRFDSGPRQRTGTYTSARFDGRHPNVSGSHFRRLDPERGLRVVLLLPRFDPRRAFDFKVTCRPGCTSTTAHSVQPVATSVTTSVCTKLPFGTGPLCATRSASAKPGGGSSQSENARTGMLARTGDGALRRRFLPGPFPDPAQRAVDRRRAHRQKPGADVRPQLQVAVPLHGGDQGRHQRLQPLAADPVRRLPENHQRLTDRVVVDASATSAVGAACRRSRPPDAHRVLPMEGGDGLELVQDPALLGPSANRVIVVPTR